MIERGLFQLVTLLSLGFFLGLKHALDTDHVVAVSTLVSEAKSLRKSSLFGAIWGLGHTTTLFLVGLIVLALKLTIPDKLGLFLEFLVGMVLVLLGATVLKDVIKKRVHLHQHKHDDIIHTHFHTHKKSFSHRHIHKSFIVGMVHGLAGSAALMLLVLTTVKSMFHGLLYILIFGVGSILGMLIIGLIIGLPFVLTAKFDKLHNGIRVLVGATSTILGFLIMAEIGFTIFS